MTSTATPDNDQPHASKFEELMSKFSGFSTLEQATKYDLTLFDLLMTLAARVTASLNLRKRLLQSPVRQLFLRQ